MRQIILSKIKHNILTMILAICSLLFVSGCMESNAAEGFYDDMPSRTSYGSKSNIPDNTLKIVNGVFYPSFMGGDWRYKGASIKKGSINAYIQIPQQMDMTMEAQKQYLKLAICPSAQHKDMWKKIKGIPLSVHVYTYKQKHSVFANCDNPMS